MSLINFQKSIFEQISAFQSRGDERLVIRFFAGGVFWVMDASDISNVSLLPPTLSIIPAAPASVRGLVQQEGYVLTVFDFGKILTSVKTPVHRSNRILMLDPDISIGVGLLVEKTYGMVSIETLLPTFSENGIGSKWTHSQWTHNDTEGAVWNWLKLDTFLNDGLFSAKHS
jgi:chemotaxis signal transduction protein